MRKKATPPVVKAPAGKVANAPAPATKTPAPKATKKSAPPPPKKKWMKGDPTSEIVIRAEEKIDANPRNPAKAATLAVIHELTRRALKLSLTPNPVVAFLTAAYAEVKKGGGSNGGAAADPFPPPE